MPPVDYPPEFWFAILIFILGAAWSLTRLKYGLGLPTLAVLGTAFAWYAGDALYNDYAEYIRVFRPRVVTNAWWQVILFLVSFLFLTPVCNRRINRQLMGRKSRTYDMLLNGINNPLFQLQLNRLFYGSFVVWIILLGFVVIRLEGDILYYFFPFLGGRIDPWSRGRIGGGIDALLALAGYIQLFVTAAFGVVAALAQKQSVRITAIICCAFTWPYFIFDRTRNTILAATIPGIAAWTLLRLRAPVIAKIVVLMGWFLVVEGWMRFVIENRSFTSISLAIQEKGVSEVEKKSRHEGLNMFEELCWINSFMAEGEYKPNWGERYFAELVNPIPRVIWPGKPLIGIDYAKLRGQEGGSEEEAGVFATVSTGMIGQGVLNFGGIVGPIFVGLIFACWVAVLTRLDLQPERVGGTLLYIFGLILTFNLGRDVTFITLYPFVFGSLISYWIGRRRGQGGRSGRRRSSGGKPEQVRQPPGIRSSSQDPLA